MNDLSQVRYLGNNPGPKSDFCFKPRVHTYLDLEKLYKSEHMRNKRKNLQIEIGTDKFPEISEIDF